MRAFNAISNRSVDSKAHRAGEKVAIPIAGDDEEAVRIASEFVTDAGFDPVVVGGLSRARPFDQGSAVYVKDMTAAELRAALGLYTHADRLLTRDRGFFRGYSQGLTVLDPSVAL